jgi:hypothetical protein
MSLSNLTDVTSAHRRSPPPRRRQLYALVGSLLLCFFVVACDGQVSEKSKNLARNLERKQPQAQGSPPGKSPGTTSPRIYLDASLSMSGYVTGSPVRHTTFDLIIDRLADYLPGCSVFKYGQGFNQELLSPANFDRSLHSPSFYNLTYNPNDVLVRQLSSDEQPALTVILTDGVQSDVPGQGNPPVVEAVQEWMEKGHTFGILMLRSEFSGPFYTELKRDWIRNGRRMARVNATARPFYAFVFSPTLHEFKELKEKFLRDFPGTMTILFTDEAIKCEVAATPQTRQPFASSNPAKERILWHRFSADIFDKKSSAAELGYEVNCRIDPDYPVKELSFTSDANCYLWKDKNFAESSVPTPEGFGLVVQNRAPTQTSQGAIVKMSLTKDLRSDFSLYQIKLQAAIRSLRDDIVDLNTEDDSDSSNTEKTYKLSSLIMALTDIHMKRRLPDKLSPRLYLTIANK